MTDAQPADQVLAALVAAYEELDTILAMWREGRHEEAVNSTTEAVFATVTTALPIAREMAEREREKDALIDVLCRYVDGGGYDVDENALTRALAAYRARAAGVEVTGHE